MAASEYEKVVLNGLDLTTWGDIEALTFVPAAKRPQFVGNSDADGEALVREAHYTNSYLELQVRCDRQESTDKALEQVGELLDAMQGCERVRGGAESTWTPNGTEDAYTFYARMAELVEVPIEVQGDLVGWLIKAPVIKLKVTCRPFLYTAERTVLEPKESSAAPQQEVFVKGVKGDVAAEARLIVKDKATQNRRYVQWGRDVVESEEPPACLITAASLVTEGFSGEAKTRSGAYSEEKVKRATAVSSATTMAGTGRIKHVGTFAVYLRVYTSSEDARFRISYRNGDGPLIPLRWKTPPVTEWADIYMGEVFFDSKELGEQTSEIRIEHKSTGAAIENDVNYVTLIPSKVVQRSRGRASNTPTKLLAYDQFEQTEGSLATKSLNVGGTWSGAGDTDDFTVIAASDYIRRNATSDSNINTGRYALAGSTEHTTVVVSARIESGTAIKLDSSRIGVIARYVDTENWLGAFLVFETADGGPRTIKVFSRVGGTVTELGLHAPSGLSTSGSPSALDQDVSLSLAVDTTGNWSLLADWGVGSTTISGSTSVLASGGALEKGKVGVYDAWTSATASSRYLDEFQVLGADNPGVVCYSGKSIEFNSQEVLREAESGEYWGPPDLPRGGNFELEPAGADERINRVVIRARRNDIEAEADSAVSDKHTTEIKVRERYLLPR